MEKYNYYESVKQDIIEYIKNNNILEEKVEKEQMDRDELYYYLQDELWSTDAVTGNSELYYDTEDACFKNLAGNSNLIYQAVNEFCIDDNINLIIQHFQDRALARYLDSTVRCYLLDRCLEDALDELGVENE